MKQSLQRKYAGVIAGLIILITGVLSGILLFQSQSSIGLLSQRSADNMSRELMAQMEKRAEAMIHFLSDALTNPLYQYDVRSISDLLGIVMIQKDVVNVYVYGTDGRIIHEGRDESANFGEPLGDSRSREAIQTRGRLVSQVEGNLLRVSIPIWIGDSALGGVKLDMSLDGIVEDIDAMRGDLASLGQQRLTDNTWTVLVTTTILVLAAIFLGFAVSGRMIQPIRALTESASRVERGDYGLRIALGRKDELGELIDTFNRMTEALERTTVSKNYVENIIGSMTDMLIVLNADGTIRMVNRAMSDHLRYDADALIGKPFRDLFPKSDGQKADTWLSKLIDKGVLQQDELTFESRDHKFVSVSLSGSVMAGEGPMPGAIVCLAQDITERKRTQEALVEAKRNAEEANRSKSAFLAAMSHEIRTPMNGVMGMTDLLLRTDLNDRQRRFVNIVHNSAETLLGIINDILDFSRIEAGKLQLDSIAFGLREVIGNVVELLAESAQGKGLELASFVASDAPDDLIGDPSRLRQILINLIGNAIKFTEEGEVVVRVTTLRAGEGSVELRFEVRDTGIGIEKQAREHLFDAFQQVDRSISRRFGGTGLGLSIARQLVEMMDGKIGVESEPGTGSTFHFTARLERGTSAAEDQPPPSDGLDGIHLLVVDDNATNREILEQYASDWGTLVESVGNGPAAIEMLRGAKLDGRAYDAAILDMVMPGMNGWELARAIKADPAIAGVRLMMLTSVGWQDDANDMREAGIDAMATKPVRPSMLHDRIMQLLSRRAPDAARAPAPAVSEDEPAGIDGESVVQSEHGFGGRILLVEDNPVNLEVALEHLYALGCQVDTASNGVEAVSAADADSYALILMDCQMPVMDGLEATRAIRQREVAAGRTRRTPIVALTANAFESDRSACIAAGMDGFLMKPLQVSALHDVLARWLDAAPASAARTSGADVLESPAAAPLDDEWADGETEEASMVLDPSALDDIRALQRDGQPDVVAKVVGMYLDNSPGLIDSLRRDLISGDLQAVQRAAHTFKSSSANVGALRLAACCRALERKCRDGRVENGEALLDRLEHEYRAVAELLTRAPERKAG